MRDRIPIDESAQLAAQLPMLIRGVYYEGWVPSHTPQTYHDVRAFLDRVAAEANLAGETEASFAAAAAARVLRAHVSPASSRTSSASCRPLREIFTARATALGCPVPRVPSFLQRFRRVLAARTAREAVGVPASGDELEGELGPVLEQLDSVGAQAAEIEARAHEQAREPA